MKTEADKLLKMKEEVEKKGKEKSRIEGALSSVMDELKEKNKINSLDQLSKEIDIREKRLSELEDEFKKEITKLEEEYEWEEL